MILRGRSAVGHSYTPIRNIRKSGVVNDCNKDRQISGEDTTYIP